MKRSGLKPALLLHPQYREATSRKDDRNFGVRLPAVSLTQRERDKGRGRPLPITSRVWISRFCHIFEALSLTMNRSATVPKASRSVIQPAAAGLRHSRAPVLRLKARIFRGVLTPTLSRWEKENRCP
ncbi:MAG: hypothetical protein IH623_23365 [Verrucomicrobia bacterium]|nr:hypothetical protein [Verrucomicrobiota bacterium]